MAVVHLMNLQAMKKILLFSDSMLKGQAKEGSMLAKKYFCSVSAFGGYRLSQLDDQLSNVKAAAYGHFNAGVIFAGTNDLAVQCNFDMQSFIDNLKNLLLKFLFCTGIEKIVVVGFTPRAYCMKSNCGARCLYLHRDETAILPVDYHRRIAKVNKEVASFIKHDDRFRQFQFLDIFSRIAIRGNWLDSYGGLLHDDGLHFSNSGNRLLDECLFKYLEA